MTDAYRGAGRPEAAYAIERAIEALSRRLDKDSLEVRRLNFVRHFPYTMASGLTIDIGDFDACLTKLEEMLDLGVGYGLSNAVGGTPALCGS